MRRGGGDYHLLFLLLGKVGEHFILLTETLLLLGRLQVCLLLVTGHRITVVGATIRVDGTAVHEIDRGRGGWEQTQVTWLVLLMVVMMSKRLLLVL